jgi:hypothetical protein
MTRHCLWFATIAPLAGCAIPATQVQVPTQSMHEALQKARSANAPLPGAEAAARSPVRALSPPGAPRPVLAAPDVRMAYLYEWIDRQGNQHFGAWIAIPLAGFDWVLNPGAAPPPGREPAPAAPPTP